MRNIFHSDLLTFFCVIFTPKVYIYTVTLLDFIACSRLDRFLLANGVVNPRNMAAPPHLGWGGTLIGRCSSNDRAHIKQLLRDPPCIILEIAPSKLKKRKMLAEEGQRRAKTNITGKQTQKRKGSGETVEEGDRSRLKKNKGEASPPHAPSGGLSFVLGTHLQ